MENIDDEKIDEANDATDATDAIVSSQEKSIIKHIVISGGGPTGLTYYGVLKESNNMGLWKYEDIKTMYGTSVGSMLAVILCLQYDWETIDDYLIKRPWNNVFKFNMHYILDSYSKRGIFNIKIIEEIFSPLFKGKDISIDVTMKEFYELTNKELHLFSTEINNYELIDFSYKTHPDWKLIEVIYCSSCLPIMFSPYLIDDECYCDGGMLCNYSLEKCIENGANPDEIIGISNFEKKTNNKITDNSTLFDYFMLLLKNLSKNKNAYTSIPNEYIIETDNKALYNFYSSSNDSNERIKLIEDGIRLVRKRNEDVKLSN
jgi:NTE family protein